MRFLYIQRRPLLANLLAGIAAACATVLAYALMRLIVHLVVPPQQQLPWEIAIQQNHLAFIGNSLPMPALLLTLVYTTIGIVYQYSNLATRAAIRSMNLLFTIVFALLGFLLMALLALATQSPPAALLAAGLLTLVSAPYYLLANRAVYTIYNATAHRRVPAAEAGTFTPASLVEITPVEINPGRPTVNPLSNADDS